MSDWIDVVAVADFQPGSCRVVTTDGDSIAVFNLDGRYYAISNICTHEDADLSDGDLEGDEIICPLHGARFSVINGMVMSPPAVDNLQTYRVRVRDGWVEVDAESEGA